MVGMIPSETGGEGSGNGGRMNQIYLLIMLNTRLLNGRPAR